MTNSVDEKNAKLENYIMYGMIFGLGGGSILSSIAFMFGNSVIAISSIGIGPPVGMGIATLLFLLLERGTSKS